MKVHKGILLLKNLLTEASVEADFLEDVSLELIETTEALWEPRDKRLRAHALARGILEGDLPLEHNHWNWRKKKKKAKPESRFFGVSWGEHVQGLMQLTRGKLCHLAEQSGLPLVYIDYIEIAPWNLPVLTDTPQFRRIGSYFIEAAIEVSRENGYEGRIGLHSLKKAERFYENCGMSNCGMQRHGYTLSEYCYFEMTPKQAQQFVEGS